MYQLRYPYTAVEHSQSDDRCQSVIHIKMYLGSNTIVLGKTNVFTAKQSDI